MDSGRKYRCTSKVYKDCEEFLSFVSPKYLASSKVSLNVGCMKVYLKSLVWSTKPCIIWL